MIKKHIESFNRWLNYNPKTATADGWVQWERDFKKSAPIRYFITRKLPDYFRPIKWKYDSIKSWVRYRTYARYHVVKTGLEPGYYEVDTLMLHSSFSLLVDFVEIQAASETLWWSEKYKLPEYKKYDRYFGLYFKFFFREPKLGIENLEWAASLDDPDSPNYDSQCYGTGKPQLNSGEFTQASGAREILELYRWWTELRPAREEVAYPEDLEDLPEDENVLYRMSDEYEEKHPEHAAKTKQWAKDSRIQEEVWAEEDTEMLIRLVKIRKRLWT